MNEDVATRLIREALGDDPVIEIGTTGDKSARVVVYVAGALAGWFLLIVALRLVWLLVAR